MSMKLRRWLLENHSVAWILGATLGCVVLAGCDPYPSNVGLDAMHPSSIRKNDRLPPPPEVPIGPEIRQKQAALRAEFQQTVASLFPSLGGNAAAAFGAGFAPIPGNQIFTLYARHPAFGDPAIASGSAALALSDWMRAHRDALLEAKIYQLALTPSSPDAGNAFILHVQ